MSSYSARVVITSAAGASVYTLQVAQGDDIPGNVAAGYGLADPLTITQQLSSDARGIMAHPEPDEATVTLIAPDATTYSALAIGDPIGVQVWPVRDYLGTPVEFYGRVAAIQGDPHDLGVKLTLSCVDYTADLAELTQVGRSAYPLEDGQARLNRITDDAGIPRMPLVPAAYVSLNPVFLAARSASVTDAYSLLRDTLDSCAAVYSRDEYGTLLPNTAFGVHTTSFRPVIQQNIVGGLLDPVTPFSVRLGAPTARRVMYAPPFRVTNVAGVYTVTVSPADSSPATGCPILSASRVQFAPSFQQSKATQLPNVTVGVDAQGNRYTWDWRVQDGWGAGGGVLVGGKVFPYSPGLPAGGGPPIVQELDSIIDVTDSGSFGLPAGLVQDYRIPFRPSTLTDWAIGTMSFQAWAEPVAIYSWTGITDNSASQKRTNAGTVETNLHPDPMGAGPGLRAGWVQNASTTLTADAGNAWRSVGKAMKIVTTVDNWGYFPTDGSTSNGTPSPLLVAGKVYTFQCMVKSDTAQSVMAIQYGANPANGTPVALTVGVWALVSVTWTQGASGFLSVRRQDRTALLGNTWLAGYLLEEGNPIPSSFWRPGDPISPNVQWVRPNLTELLTVAGAAAGKLPNNREWISGLVTGTQLKLAGGRATLDLDVAPPSYDFVSNREQLGSSLGVASLDAPVLSGVTLAQLAARDTLNDYTMVRGS